MTFMIGLVEELQLKWIDCHLFSEIVVWLQETMEEWAGDSDVASLMRCSMISRRDGHCLVSSTNFPDYLGVQFL